MKEKIGRIGLMGLIGLISLMLAFPAAGDTNAAVAYLKTQSMSSWVAMGLAAAGETPDVSALKTVTGDKATDYAAAILGLTANNKDPRTYPDEDFVVKLKSYYSGGQIGDASIQNDDIFGILALLSAGVDTSDTVVAGAKDFVLTHQNSDGGWGFASAGSSDTNTTAAAIMALLEAGVAGSDQQIIKAVNYLKSAQNNDGGFPYDPVSPWGTASDAASTAWIISAINRLGGDMASWTKNGKSPTDFLLTLQDPTGFFAYQAGSGADSFTPITTAYAVVALNNKYYPVKILDPGSGPGLTLGANVSFRIVGSADDLCDGEASAPNALELVKIAAVTCGFTYNITQTSFGPYLDRIGTDAAAGADGWLYSVNFVKPNIGAADYQLASGDYVLWYFSTRKDLDGEKVTQELNLSANVEGGSNQGGGNNSSVGFSLSVNAEGGQVDAGGSDLGFGSVAKGVAYGKNVTIKNTGNNKIHVEAVVTGDDVFRNYLQLNQAPWRDYSDSLNSNESKDVGVGLTVPASYAGSGNKNGKLIFWAIQSN